MLNTKVEEIRQLMINQFGKGVKEQTPNTLKVHTNTIDDVGIIVLHQLSIQHACTILLKRSGTGITILVTM